MSKTCSEQVAKTLMLTAGMQKNIELIRNKGLDEQFISNLQSAVDQMAVYNEECDKLKEEVRVKTKQLNTKANEIRMQVKEAKKTIKRDFDKSMWKELGILDSK